MHGWDVDLVFVENRLDGVSDEALEMLARFDLVIVRDLSRLTRVAGRAADIRVRLEADGTRIITTVDGPVGVRVESGPPERLHGIFDASDRVARDVHSRRVKVGMAKARARRESGQ